MIVVWHRGPIGAATGHIGVVATINGAAFTSIEGNSGRRQAGEGRFGEGDRVAEMERSLTDSKLIGAGWVD